MRVMTWNLWWRFGPWEQRAAAIRQVIAAEAPDIVCLQEVWSLDGDSIASWLGAERSPTTRSRAGVPMVVPGSTTRSCPASRWPMS